MATIQFVINAVNAQPIETITAKIKHYIDNAVSLHGFTPSDNVQRTIIALLISGELHCTEAMWVHDLIMDVLNKYAIKDFNNETFTKSLFDCIKEALELIGGIAEDQLSVKVFNV